MRRELDALGKGPGEIKLLDLESLGASKDQIDKAQTLLDHLRLYDDRHRASDQIGSNLNDLSEQLNRTSGLSEADEVVQKIKNSITEFSLANPGDMTDLSSFHATLDLAQGMAARIDAGDKLKLQTEEHARAMQELGTWMEKTINPAQKYADRLADLTKFLAEGAINQMEFNNAAKGLSVQNGLHDAGTFSSIGTTDFRALPGLIALGNVGGGEDAAKETAKNTAEMGDWLKSIDNKLDNVGRYG